MALSLCLIPVSSCFFYGGIDEYDYADSNYEISRCVSFYKDRALCFVPCRLIFCCGLGRYPVNQTNGFERWPGNTGRTGLTGLHGSADADILGYMSAMLWLIFGANPNIRASDGTTALDIALEKKHVITSKLLILVGAKCENALSHIVENGTLQDAISAIQNGANISLKDENGNNLLHLACTYKNIDVAKFFIQNKIELLYETNLNGLTAFDQIREADHEVRIRLIDVLPIHFACEIDNFDRVQIIINNNKEIVVQQSNKTLSVVSTNQKSKKIIPTDTTTSICNIIDIINSKRPTDGMTPLHISSMNGNEMITSYLISNGALVNDTDNYFRTPLHFACSSKKADVVKLLLYHGASCDCLSIPDNKFPLHIAIEHQMHDCILNILEAYSIASMAKDCDGQLALHIAVKNSTPIIIIDALIASYPSSTTVLDKDNLLPLHVALINNANVEVLDKLVSSYPAAAGIADNNQQLPLHLAVKYRADLDIINQLISIYPSAACQKNAEGLPIVMQIGSISFEDIDYIVALICADLPFSADGTVRSNHGYSWALFMFKSVYSDELMKVIIERIFLKFPTLIRRLVFAEDEQGRKVFDYVSKSIRNTMKSYVYFCGRYDIFMGPPVHHSATSVVYYAKDSLKDDRRVALKFMRERSQWMREIGCRLECNLDERYVLPILRNHSSESDPDYNEQAKQFELSDFPYCLVLQAADKNLKNIIDSERIAGQNWEGIKSIFLQLIRSVSHLHDKRLLHGDIKPLNVMRIGAEIKIIDLDASCRFNEITCLKYSTAFLPPELLYCDESNGLIHVRKDFIAMPSIDVWSLGCILFHMVSSEPLFLANIDDNLDQDGLQVLLEWSTEMKNKRLTKKIPDPLALNLVWLMLEKDISRRISLSRIQNHPFLTGKTVGRLVGNPALFDVFLSYRVAANRKEVETIYELLTARGIKVWWDVKCLKSGEDWKQGFCTGLINSTTIVCLLSRQGFHMPYNPRQNFALLRENSPVDNVFFEHRIALELKAMGLIERVFPLMIGDLDPSTTVPDYNPLSTTYGNWKNWGPYSNWPINPPDTHVSSVEIDLGVYFDKQGLGSPLVTNRTVKSVLEELRMYQGAFIKGDGNISFEQAVQTIIEMVQEIKAKNNPFNYTRQKTDDIFYEGQNNEMSKQDLLKYLNEKNLIIADLRQEIREIKKLNNNNS